MDELNKKDKIIIILYLILIFSLLLFFIIIFFNQNLAFIIIIPIFILYYFTDKNNKEIRYKVLKLYFDKSSLEGYKIDKKMFLNILDLDLKQEKITQKHMNKLVERYEGNYK